MKIIDNVSDRHGDDLKREITPGSKVPIAESTFSIFAFSSLRKELDQVSELESIVASPAFVTTKLMGVEDARIECARNFFADVNEVRGPGEVRRGRQLLQAHGT